MKTELNKNVDGVSPVIGVILMVAITVVLAAIVFVMVSRLNDGQVSSGNLALSHGEISSTYVNYTVNSVIPDDIPYSEIKIVSNGFQLNFTVNGVVPSGFIAAGDEIVIQDLTPATSYTFNLVRDNQIIWTDTITTAA